MRFIKHICTSLFLSSFLFNTAFGQAASWQQEVAYEMEIDFDHKTHRFSGKQTLTYTNNSPDTLDKVFYHLYFNAFQPGSMMDVRSRSIEDPDRRVGSRILYLKENEIGFHKIDVLKQQGKTVDFEVEGTVLTAQLKTPLLPGKSTKLYMEFNSQVPKQIRRSGRDNKEGISYSMTQWYPKLCEYDQEGWHSNPYIAREFHGVWGDFDVHITLDSSFVIGGTGYLQNPEEIGHGYLKPGQELKRKKSDKLTWHFHAPKVHDFAWAADPDYKHDVVRVDDDLELHFFYQTDTLVQNWDSLQPYAVKAFKYMNKHFGRYPYKQYSVIQGGDGGMEYPMCTLITSHGSFGGLVSVTVHEALHSWYQGLLATNESLYPWMDEGFTSYAQYMTLDHLYKKNKLNPLSGSYGGYYALVKRNLQEPLTTHADHYITNRAYGTSSYSKGAVFLHQLSYIIGSENFEKGMLEYFNTWKYKHPTPTDFKRVMEKVSGIELDWYLQQWIGTTNTIDYGIRTVEGKATHTEVILERIGEMPMPLDVVVTLSDSSEVVYHIPLRIMRGRKEQDKYLPENRVNQEPWPWTYPYYSLNIQNTRDQILSIQIDPSTRLADVEYANDRFPFQNYKIYYGRKED